AHLRAWVKQPSGTTQDLYRVWGSSDGRFSAVGAGVALTTTGAGWTSQPTDQTGAFTLFGVYGRRADDVFAVGSDAASMALVLNLGSDGTWRRQTTGSYPALYRVFENIDGQAWGVGTSVVLHTLGDGNWSPQTVTGTLHAIWGSSSTDLYAVGLAGRILHSVG